MLFFCMVTKHFFGWHRDDQNMTSQEGVLKVRSRETIDGGEGAPVSPVSTLRNG